jgi:hypothetical protein
MEEAGHLKRHDPGLLEEFHVAQDLPRRPVGDYLPVPQDDDAVGVEGLLGLVFDDDEGNVVAILEFLGDLEHPELADGIEVRRRLVEAQDTRLYCQNRRYGEPLLLSAGEGSRLTSLEALEAHPSQHAFHAAGHLLPVYLEVLRSEGHLEGDVGGEELRLEVLEDEPDLLGELADPALPGGVSFDPHLALHPTAEKVWDQAVERDAQSALPRAGRPHDDHELPLGHLQVHPL